MPRPVFIICAKGHAQDSETNTLSVFSVIERFSISVITQELQQPPDKPALIAMNEFSAVAVWMKLPEDDSEQQYQHQVWMHFPDGRSHKMLDVEDISFKSDELPFQRFLMRLHGAPFTKVGTYRIESKLRPLGGDDNSWIHQDYPFIVVATDEAAALMNDEAARAAETSGAQ